LGNERPTSTESETQLDPVVAKAVASGVAKMGIDSLYRYAASVLALVTAVGFFSDTSPLTALAHLSEAIGHGEIAKTLADLGQWRLATIAPVNELLPLAILGLVIVTTRSKERITASRAPASAWYLIAVQRTWGSETGPGFLAACVAVVVVWLAVAAVVEHHKFERFGGFVESMGVLFAEFLLSALLLPLVVMTWAISSPSRTEAGSGPPPPTGAIGPRETL
jgi:hypothetical protein